MLAVVVLLVVVLLLLLLEMPDLTRLMARSAHAGTGRARKRGRGKTVCVECSTEPIAGVHVHVALAYI